MSIIADLYPDEEPYDQRDENYASPDDEDHQEAPHYCEVCDRSFPTEDCMTEHNSRHKQCGIDGCTFSAHPLLLEKHIGMQHNTGLYQRMKNLSTPEDIEKWLIERKKRYPTKANIELKKAEQEEKVKRGEVIKEKKKNVAQRKTKRTSNTKDRRRKPQRHTHHVSREEHGTIRLYRGLRPFPGTACLKERDNAERVEEEEPVQSETAEDVNNQISDEEEEVSHKPEPTKPLPFSLVANYGSDSDDDEAPEEVPVKRIKIDDHNEPNCNDKTDDGTKLNSNPVEPGPQPGSSFKKGKPREKHNKELRPKSMNQREKQTKQPPRRMHLLERLLSRSIQHERNLICQCIKYIVDNNFFD